MDSGDFTLSKLLDAATRRTVGVRDIPLVLLVPRRLFARVEDVTAYAWPLVVLLTSVTLIGYATVQTGLIDREIDRNVQESIARLESEQRDVVERSALRELYEGEYELGEFKKLLTRIQVVAAAPARALAVTLLVAAVLYGVVALTGRKPEWHTLLTICVFAAFINVLRQLTTLALMLRYGTLEVDTSLALLARLMAQDDGASPMSVAAAAGLLSALDPFRIWFWLVVVIGLSATAQLRGWRAWVTCSLCWLVAAGARCGLAIAAAQSMTTVATNG
jgi:hypothetical protein